MTIVIHIKQCPANWKQDKRFVYIGRPSIFGNPFSHKPRTLAKYMATSREDSVMKYEQYFLNRINDDPKFLAEVLKLRNKILVCFCKPLACHGDILSNFVNYHFGDD